MMKRNVGFLLGIIIIFSLLLRIWGIGFGLPQLYHIDEYHYVPEAVRYVADRNLQPSYWANPTLFKYLLASEFSILQFFLNQSGQLSSNQNLYSFFIQHTSMFYLLARITCALFGVLTVLYVFKIGSIYGTAQGLLGAGLLAGAFLHVRDSHYAVGDVPMTFFLTLSIYFCLRYIKDSDAKFLYFAGAAAGLAFGTKFTALLLVIEIFIAWLLKKHTVLRNRPLRWIVLKDLILAYIFFGIAFVVVTPYALIDFQTLFESIRAHYGMGKIGFAGYELDPSGGWIFYLKAIIWGLGIPFAILSVFSILQALYKHEEFDILLVVPIILLYFYLGKQKAYFVRFIIPAIPLLAVLSGRFIWDVANAICSKIFQDGYKHALSLLLFSIVIVPSLSFAVRSDILLTRKDTRTLAKEWIEQNIVDSGKKFFVEWHTPPLSSKKYSDVEKQIYQGWVNGSILPVPDSIRPYEVDSSWIIGIAENSLKHYKSKGYDYLILSSYLYEIPRIDQEEQFHREAIYELLDAEYTLVYEIRPYAGKDKPPFIFDQMFGPIIYLYDYERPGPTLKIYELCKK